MTRPDPDEATVFAAPRLLTLAELCAWLNITERHARKLVERNAIPYRKVGHLLRFCAADVDAWSRPAAGQKQSNGSVSMVKPRALKSTRSVSYW